MKNIFKYFGVLLSVALMGAVTACNPTEIEESADIGLGIKVFFPTKVVAGQPMTINGSGFSDVREIVFPDGVSVTSFELVSNDMIRVTAPSGIAAAGGYLKVRTADDEAESRVALTLGRTVVSGYSKQDGESISGGDQLTVYGEDLEFISRIELLDTDGNPLILEDEDFYRKGTNSIIFNIPKKTIFDGTFVGKMYTFDGKEFLLPELTYEPAADEGGHWETVKTVIWSGDGSAGAVSWSGQYRYGLDGHDGNNECIATFPQEIWDKIKTETFYVLLKGEDPQIRVTSGWWSTTWTGADIQPGNEKLTDNGDGTWTLEVNLAGDPLVDVLDEQHLLLTGDRYTPLEIYFEEEEWIDGGGHWETVKTTLWKGDGSAGAVSWSGQYRYGLDGHDGNNECIATFPQEIWDKIKSETFYVLLQGEDPQIRVTSGWWSTTWTGADIQPGNEKLTDNGDGTWTLEVNLSGDPLLDVLDEQHLLLTGDRYTPLEIYFQEEIWVDGGDGGAKEVVMWEGDGSAGVVDWNGVYRFGLDGHDGNNECIATLPENFWNVIKSGTFYMMAKGSDWVQMRITTGWWSTTWTGDDIMTGNERIIDNGDGTYYIEINFGDDPIVGYLDEQHLLFTGSGFTPLKLYYYE